MEEKENKFNCPHGGIDRPFKIEILGVLCELESSSYCFDCTK